MGFLTDELLDDLKDLTYHPYRIIYGRVPKDLERSRVRVAISRLERRGLIRESLVEGELCVQLTKLGEEYLKLVSRKQIEKSILSLNIQNKKWDGLWRVVVFDIPEQNRRVRQALRMGLKTLEFKQLQKISLDIQT